MKQQNLSSVVAEHKVSRTRVVSSRATTSKESNNGSLLVSKPTPKPLAAAAAAVESNGAFKSRKPVLDMVGRGTPRDDREVEEFKISSGPKQGTTRASEQYAKFRRRLDSSLRVVAPAPEEDERDLKVKELQRKVDASEGQVKVLQEEMVGLKEELEKMKCCNAELELKNRQLRDSLVAAEAKTLALEKLNQVGTNSKQIQQPSGFNNLRSSIANKLAASRLQNQALLDPKNVGVFGIQSRPKAPDVQMKDSNHRQFPPPPAPPIAAPPPPPPPPPSSHVVRASPMQNSTTLVELYHSLTKKDSRKVPLGKGNVSNDAHNSIVGEIQNRSSHLLAIKADVETKGAFIRSLIEKVNSAAYSDIEDVLIFVDWIDQELSTLVDERAVLKHFSWPEKKADALREAAFEYRALKRIANEASSFEDDACLPCEAALKKITNLLEKLEQSIQRLTRLRTAATILYRENKIPTDWMSDIGMVTKIKLASVTLAKVYLRRISVELSSVRRSEKESAQEALLNQGIRFAYRTHQFAGGLDTEAMCALEELRKRVQSADHRNDNSRDDEVLSGMKPS